MEFFRASHFHKPSNLSSTHAFLKQSRTIAQAAVTSLSVLLLSDLPAYGRILRSFSSLQVNLALKQKSDIEHYRNKLRLKAKRKGYYDFPSADGSSSGPALVQRQRRGHERAAGERGRPVEPDDERGSTYVKSHRRWGRDWKSGIWAACKQIMDPYPRTASREETVWTVIVREKLIKIFIHLSSKTVFCDSAWILRKSINTI